MRRSFERLPSISCRLSKFGEVIEEEIARREEHLLARIEELEERLRDLSDRSLSELPPKVSYSEDRLMTSFAFSSLPELDMDTMNVCLESCSSSGDFVRVLKEYPRLQVEPRFLRLFRRDTLEELLADLTDVDLRYLFAASSRAGDSELLKTILRVSNSRLCNGEGGGGLSTPLIEACSKGTPEHIETVSLLLSLETHPLKTNNGTTPLHQAVACGAAETVDLILGAIEIDQILAALDARDSHDRTPEELLTISGIPQPIANSIDFILRSHRIVGVSHKGNESYRQGEFERAAELYLSGMELCGSGFGENRVKLLYNLGRANYRLGRWLVALNCLNECAQADPSYTPAYIQRANCFVALLSFESAGGEFSRAAELAKMNSDDELSKELKKKENLCKSLSSNGCPYQILGLKKGAGFGQVKSAFREIAKRVHPDKVHGRGEEGIWRARCLFQRAQDAQNRILSGHQGPLSGHQGPPISHAHEIFTLTPPSSPTKAFHNLLEDSEDFRKKPYIFSKYESYPEEFNDEKYGNFYSECSEGEILKDKYSQRKWPKGRE